MTGLGLLALGGCIWAAIIALILHAVVASPEEQRARAEHPDDYAVFQSWTVES